MTQAARITTLISIFAVTAHSAMAQSGPVSRRGAYEVAFENLPLILGVIVLAGAFYTILRLFSMFIKMEELRILRERGIVPEGETALPPQKPLLTRLWSKLQGAVPVSREKEILFEHEYDGIRELDNSLPPWWLGLFYLTIIISVVYIYFQHFSDVGLSSREAYELEMERAQDDIEAYLAGQA
ncbi:MAG: cbb3-type cytochrome c oxidase N-terminal domain-containing protein, partial [Saprospiraceae bacterium]|nr:cbb3-type cytochrome c oxidase N-terminal domain-containing protein [Saprospiraceae bacterium]